MSRNPNPSRVTDALWWFWLQLKAMEPTSRLGGIWANKRGYHNSRSANLRQWPGNYSILDAEDGGGPADTAAALDWTFPEAQRGNYRRIELYTGRLLASARDKNDPRLNGMREFYGQADADRQVEGWDCRYDRGCSSDPSHLWHIHFSFDRDKVILRSSFEPIVEVLRGNGLAKRRPAAGTPTPTRARSRAANRPPGGRTLRVANPMMTGRDVSFVQSFIGERRCGPADGVFGRGTGAGVEWYQRLRGIAVDGAVGPQTWRNMGVEPTY
jgi:peptidoglycan hydrolase-like protein with peptidoglycan-binding domain